MLIKLRSVSKAFGDQTVIENCNLEIEQPGLISLVGKSGAGKSTLLALIAGLTNPDQGDVEVTGSTISSMNEEERAAFRLKNIGIVFQDFKLIPSLSVYDNVFLALYPRRDIDAPEKEERISLLLAAVGLEPKRSQIADKLSGGEKQRVAIARSLANRPAVVLADEPTGNLDSATAKSILELFEEMYRKFQTAFVIVTHDEEVASRAEVIYTIKDGIVEV